MYFGEGARVKLGLSHSGMSQLRNILTIRRRRKRADFRSKSGKKKVTHMEIHNRPRALQQKLLRVKQGGQKRQSKLAYIGKAGLISKWIQQSGIYVFQEYEDRRWLF